MYLWLMWSVESTQREKATTNRIGSTGWWGDIIEFNCYHLCMIMWMKMLWFNCYHGCMIIWMKMTHVHYMIQVSMHWIIFDIHIQGRLGESDADMIREILFSIDAEKEEALRELEWAQTRVIINDFHMHTSHIYAQITPYSLSYHQCHSNRIISVTQIVL